MEELKVKIILSLLGLSLRRLPLLLNKFARFSGLPFFLTEYGSVSRKPFVVQYFKDRLQLFSCFVENIGVEPMTSCMPCKRSSQLS